MTAGATRARGRVRRLVPGWPGKTWIDDNQGELHVINAGPAYQIIRVEPWLNTVAVGASGVTGRLSVQLADLDYDKQIELVATKDDWQTTLRLRYRRGRPTRTRCTGSRTTRTPVASAGRSIWTCPAATRRVRVRGRVPPRHRQRRAHYEFWDNNGGSNYRVGAAIVPVTETIATDLHGHTRFSDGRAEPEDYVAFRAELGMQVIAISDHDSFAGVPRAAEAARELGVTLVPAMEVTSFIHFGTPRAEQIHILAYFPPERALDGSLGDDAARRARGRGEPSMARAVPRVADVVARGSALLPRSRSLARAACAAPSSRSCRTS